MFLFSGGCPSAYIKQSLFIHSTSGNGGKPVKKIPASATVLPTMKVEVQSPYNRISISHNRKEFWELLGTLYEVHVAFKKCIPYAPSADEICREIEDFILELQRNYTLPQQFDMEKLTEQGAV